jgi:Tol biopolymer transport system component
MTQRPDRYFPYRYGEAFWRWVGQRWGDEVVGEVMQASASLGTDRAFKRHTGFDLNELGDEWKEVMQTTYLPQIGSLERPRKIAQPLLNERRTGGIIPVYVAPALSSDGRQIAYISTGSLLKAEVFLDLYLADATTGKRLKRLTNSTLNAETEELRYAYSQSAFSPDGRSLVYTGYRKGKDVLFLLDVKSRNVVNRLDTDLDAMVGPSFSPDGKRIVFSGSKGGFSNLYVIDVDGRNLRQLTKGVYAGLMPQWSPDGKRIAFVSDRGPGTDVEKLKFGKWEINLLDLESGNVETIPGQSGKNLNPMWAPDGRSVAFLSDRTGIQQIFLYDFDTKQHYQLTQFIGGVQSVTENSPAMTWARQADKLAFVYFDNGDYTVWSLSNPRQLKKEPYREPVVTTLAVARPGTAVIAPVTDSAALRAAQAASKLGALATGSGASDTANGRRQSVYRAPGGLRPSGELPAGAQSPVSVAALRDSVSMALPTDSSLKEEKYKPTLRPEAISRPQIGYAQDNYGRGVYGGSAILFGDLLGNRQLLVGASVNGRLEEAQVALNYTNYSNRLNYSTGFQQQPVFLLANYNQQNIGNGQVYQQQTLDRYIIRQTYLTGIYPVNRFTRFELGGSFLNIDRSSMFISQGVDFYSGYTTGFYVDSIKGAGTVNYLAPTAAFVQDNAIFGNTGPIYGHRYRMELAPYIGKQGFMTYIADLRRYDALLFSFFTIATRFSADVSAGSGENLVQKYIGNPFYIRGYDRENYISNDCKDPNADCTAALQMLGSRTAVANAELRFPLIRRFDLGFLPFSLPPVDGLVFYDAGMAWSAGQSVTLTRPANYDFTKNRFPLRAYGYGIRMNVFGLAILRLDYSVPRDSFNKKGYWWWTLGPSF